MGKYIPFDKPVDVLDDLCAVGFYGVENYNAGSRVVAVKFAGTPNALAKFRTAGTEACADMDMGKCVFYSYPATREPKTARDKVLIAVRGALAAASRAIP